MPRSSRLFGSQGPVVQAGFALITAGISCLYVSDKAAHGWWQGTLQAFGVGFIIAGVVDVIAISGLNQIMARTTDERLRAGNDQARSILGMFEGVDPGGIPVEAYRRQAQEATQYLYYLNKAGGQIDPQLHAELDRLSRTKWPEGGPPSGGDS